LKFGVYGSGFGLDLFLELSPLAQTWSPRARLYYASVATLRVQGSGFRVQGSGFRVYGLRLGFMVHGLWFMVYGLWFMVYGL